MGVSVGGAVAGDLGGGRRLMAVGAAAGDLGGGGRLVAAGEGWRG
jgi:hypothetical protein